MGTFFIPDDIPPLATYKNKMRPKGLTLHQPAAKKIEEFAKYGFPTQTGKPWTIQEMWEAVARGPQQLAMSPEAIEHFWLKAIEKFNAGQAILVNWDDIKNPPPPQLKISPIAAIQHKLKEFRSTLDLSFTLQLSNGSLQPSVNNTMVKTAPRGAIDQLGHSLAWMIHAFVEAKDEEKIFMAIWDVTDGFWRMDCCKGEQWNFAYVLPQPPGSPVILVTTLSLQMGWVELLPFFCAGTKTSRDIAMEYSNTAVRSLNKHKFEAYLMGDVTFKEFQEKKSNGTLRYLLKVYVDNFMLLIIPATKEEMLHIATAVMTGIHDVFPGAKNENDDPISLQKMKNGESQLSLKKTHLGIEFDGDKNILWLKHTKRDKLLHMLYQWLRLSCKQNAGIPFNEFQLVISKLRHAFIALPAENGLMLPCNSIL
jgi:hypothetical protein